MERLTKSGDGMTRDEIATQVAGLMAATAVDADWIAERAYNIADALLKVRGVERREVKEKPKKKRRNNPNALKKHLTGDWQDLETLRKAAGITYAQATYQIKKLDVEVRVEERNKKLYRLPKKKMELPEEDGKDPRLEFAQSLGYKTIPAALEAMGSWQFENQFKSQL